jgi:hypothetical protein
LVGRDLAIHLWAKVADMPEGAIKVILKIDLKS